MEDFARRHTHMSTKTTLYYIHPLVQESQLSCAILDKYGIGFDRLENFLPSFSARRRVLHFGLPPPFFCLFSWHDKHLDARLEGMAYRIFYCIPTDYTRAISSLAS